jgi:hypothetical protein
MKPLKAQRVSRVRRLLRVSGWIASLGLILFHVWLFAGRLREASLTAESLLRWILGAALLTLALYFRRRGLSLVRGRPAIVFWVLALLLHLGPLPVPAIHEPVPELMSLLPWSLAAPLVAALLVHRYASRAAVPQWARERRRTIPAARWNSVAPLALRFSPRPPPAA